MAVQGNKRKVVKLKQSPTLASGKRVLDIEADAIRSLVGRLDDNFEKAVDVILKCRGRVVVTGMGKSGQICRKIAATLASTVLCL